MKLSGHHFPKDVILTAIRWSLRYKLSYRDIEELIAERCIGASMRLTSKFVISGNT